MANQSIQFKNQTDNSCDMYIMGDIVGSQSEKWDVTDICPEDVRQWLEDINNTTQSGILNIYVNSCGGSVFGGIAIYNFLNRCQKTKNVYVDGIAGSIASVIAMCGDNLNIPDNAFLMIHNPFILTSGNSTDLRKMADDLDIMKQSLLSIYQTKLQDSIDINTISELMDNETWLNGTEAQKYFKVNVTSNNRMAAKCDSDMWDKFKNTPQELLQAENKLEETTEISDNTDQLKIEKEKLILECLI